MKPTRRLGADQQRADLDGKLVALTAKVGPKGQVVIPKDILDLFFIEPGDNVLVLADRDQGIAIKTIKGNEGMFAKLFGSAFSPGDESDGAGDA